MTSQQRNIEIISCKSALNKLSNKRLPYSYDLNIYRGCAHSCTYCYAIYSHKYLDESSFSQIFVKQNIVEVLDKELSRKSWKKEIINIGGVTDSYQETEAQQNLMPEILRIFIKHKTPAIISTKSDLILRDIELIDELSQLTYVNIASTITTLNESIQAKIEPGASSSIARFNMLKEFRRTNASVALHTMPIIPYLTDSYENIEQLCIEAKKANVHYMLPGLLYLRGETKKVFLDFLHQTFPQEYLKLTALQKDKTSYTHYKSNLYKNTVNQLLRKHGISTNYTKVIQEKMPQQPNINEQLTINF